VGELSYDSLIENLRRCQMESKRKSLTMLRLQTAQIARCSKKFQEIRDQGSEIARAVSNPQFSTTSGVSKYQSGTICSVAEGRSSASAAALGVQSESLVLAEAISLLETTHDTLTQLVHKTKYPQKQLRNMRDFDLEVAEFQSSLDKALAGIRDGVAKFCSSVPFEGSHGPSFACHSLPCKQASGGLIQPTFDGDMLDTGVGLRQGCVKDLPEMPRIPEVAVLVSDSTMIASSSLASRARTRSSGDVSL